MRSSSNGGAQVVSVVPPEYWPSPMVFALAAAADRLVLGDTLQYSRQSYQNRARLRTPQGWQWISVPLKGGQHGRPIREVEVRHKLTWTRTHWRALHYNYRRSPYFDYFEPILAPIFQSNWERLGALTCRTVEVLAELFGISTPIVRASRLEGRPASVPAILERCGADRMLSAADRAEVDQAFAPRVDVLNLAPLRYRQNFEGFEPGMSALDLLFNYGPDGLAMIRKSVRLDAAAIHES